MKKTTSIAANTGGTTERSSKTKAPARAGQKQTTLGRNHSRLQQLIDAVEVVDSEGQPLHKALVVIRESDRQAFKEFKAMLEKVLIPRAQTLPGAQKVLDYGITLVSRNAAGDALRQTLGAEPYYVEDSREVLGWLFKVDGTLFFLVLNSAAKAKVKVDQDYNITSVNSFTVAAASIVTRYKVTILITGPLNRVIRVAGLAEPLKKALIMNRTIVESTVEGKIDMSSDPGIDQWDLAAMFIERSYRQTVQGMLNGKHNLLLTNRWPLGEQQIPGIGYKFRSKDDKHVVPDLDKIELVQDFITWCAEDEDTLSNKEVVKRMSEKHNWASATFRQRVANEDACATEAVVQHAIVLNALRSGLDLWKTGTYQFIGEIPQILNKDNLLEGMRDKVIENVVDGRHLKMFSIDLDFHHELLPEGRWVDPELLEKAARRLKTSKTIRTVGADRRPLRAFPDWVEGETQYAFSSSYSWVYALLARPVAQSTGRNGKQKPWYKKDDSNQAVLMAFSPKETHQALADAVIAGLEQGTLVSRAGLFFEEGKDLEDVDTLLDGIADLKRTIVKSETALEVALENGMKKQVAHYMRALEDAQNELSELEVELGKSHAAADNRRAIQSTEIMVGELLETMAMLRSVETGAPQDFAYEIQRHIHRFRVRPSEDGVMGIFEAWMRLTTDDGVVVAGPVTFEVRDRNRGNAEDRRESVMRAFFTENLDLSSLAEKFEYKTDVVRAHINREFQEIIPEGSLRRALLTCPIPEVRQIMWEALCAKREKREFKTPNGVNPAFASHILKVYTDSDRKWSRAWFATRVDWYHEAMEFVQAHGPDGAQWVDLRNATGAKYSAQNERMIAWVLSTGREGVFGPVFEFGSIQDHKTNDRVIKTHRCPFCRTRTVTHILHVPEVTNGLICTTCRRAPTSAAVRFPESYMAVGANGIVLEPAA